MDGNEFISKVFEMSSSHFSIYFVVVIFQIVVWALVISSIVSTIIKIFKRTANHKFFKNNIIYKNLNQGDYNIKKNNEYKDVTKETLSRFNTEDLNGLKEFFYNKFVEFENAYNDLDYNAMKILSTKQMFQNYYTGISLDLETGKKRIIKDIEKKKVILFELDSTIAKQVATLMIEISYINYLLDKNGNVISGSRFDKTTEKFEVVFRKDFSREEITKCPNCGSSIVGNQCEYCRSIVKNEEFKISSIKKIIEN